MGCSQSLFNNQSCAVALSPEAVGHHGGHTLVWVRLLLHLGVQTENESHARALASGLQLTS